MCKSLLVQKLKKQACRLHGGLNVAFISNCSPIHTKDNHCSEFYGALNCCIESDWKQGFKNNPEFRETDFCTREGNPSLADIRKLKEKLCCWTQPLAKSESLAKSERQGDNLLQQGTRCSEIFCFQSLSCRQWPHNGPTNGNVCEGPPVMLMDSCTCKIGERQWCLQKQLML